jgi:hypothetical protein
MFSRLVSSEDVAYILDLDGTARVDEACASGHLALTKKGPRGPRFRVGDIVIFRLAQVIQQVGVEPEKAFRYAEAVLGARLLEHDANVMEWVENETQELFCLIADNHLARIFLRSKEDFREVEVGAVRPVLFPVTKCEVNVFRAIRPVILRTRELFGEE